MDVVLGFLAGGCVGIASVVAAVLIVEHWFRPREMDPREVQRRTEGRGR